MPSAAISARRHSTRVFGVRTTGHCGNDQRSVVDPTPGGLNDCRGCIMRAAFASLERWTGVQSLGVAIRGAKGVSEGRFTPLQGQYLAFIRAYTLIHRVPPSESDMQRFFWVTPPSVHRMVLLLEERGWVQRVPGKARSLRVLVAPEALPPLEDPSVSDLR